MTEPSPRSVTRARRILARTAATALVGCLLAASPLPASATTDDEPVVPEGVVSLALQVGAHGTAQAGAPLTATATVSNGSAEALGESAVRLELNRTPLSDAAALDDWLDTGAASGSFDVLDTEAVQPVSAGASVETALLGSIESIGDLAPGVYPIRATVAIPAADDGAAPSSRSAQSVLTVRSGEAPRIGVLVPITATPASGALLSANELTALTAVDGALTAQLDGVAGTSAVLAVDPAIVAAIRVLGSAAPVSAVDWLTRLAAIPNERFALQFADADATVQARAELPELLTPSSLGVFADAADFTAAATPEPTAAPEETPVPDDAELGTLSRAADGVVWPDDAFTGADLTSFQTYLGDEVTTIAPSTRVEGSAGANAVAGDAELLVFDALASQTLTDAAAEVDDAAREALLAEAGAQLFFAGDPAAGLLVGLDRDETRDSEALADVLSLTGTVRLDALRSTEPVSVRLRADEEQAADTAERATGLGFLLDDEKRLGAFATILDDPQLLLGPNRMRMLRLISVGSETFETDLTEHRAATVQTLNSVGIQDPRPIQLLTANVDLPVWVRNDLPWPVTLRLQVLPSDSRIDIERMTDVTALPASNTRVNIPVASRIASGELDVRFSLSSPTGVPIGSPKVADVTVRAEWEGIGLGILGGLIVLLLGLGIIRTVRRRRRDAAGSEAPGASDAPDAPREASADAAGGASADATTGDEPTTDEGAR